ncbi:hypothetical protein CHS0354_027860, partial [Potamilus streckersoni]
MREDNRLVSDDLGIKSASIQSHILREYGPAGALASSHSNHLFGFRKRIDLRHTADNPYI